MPAISPEIIARGYDLQRQSVAQAALDQQTADADAAAEAERTRSNTWGEALGNVPVQLASGAVGLVQSGYGLTNMLTGGLLDRATGGYMSNKFQEAQQAALDLQSGPTRQAMQDVHGAFETSFTGGLKAAASNPAWLQNMGVSSLPAMLPAIAGARLVAVGTEAAAVAGGIGQLAAKKAVEHATERAVIGITAAQNAGQTNVDAINAIRAKGGDAGQQQLGGMIAGPVAGVATAVVSKLSGAAAIEGRVANMLPGGVRTAETRGLGAASTVLGAAGRETVDESGQSGSQQLAQNLVTPNTPIMQGVWEQAAAGGLLGFGLGAAMGGVVSVSTPRSSANTPLGEAIAAGLEEANTQAGDVLKLNAISAKAEAHQKLQNDLGRTEIRLPDGSIVHGTHNNLDATRVPTGEAADDLTPYERNQLRSQGWSDAQLGSMSTDDAHAALAGNHVDLGNTPLPEAQPDLPVENIDLGHVPVPRDPLKSLYDITGRQPSITHRVAGLPQVEEIAPPPRSGLLGVLDAQRGRGLLGGTDLFGAPMDWQGAVPGPQVAESALVPAPAPTGPQGSLDFNAPLPTWKQRLARELGVKPASFRGKVWDQFAAALEATGMNSADPRADDFLRGIAPQLIADPATAPLFAAKLAEKYPALQAAPSAVAPVAPAPAPAPVAAPVATSVPVAPAPTATAAAALAALTPAPTTFDRQVDPSEEFFRTPEYAQNIVRQNELDDIRESQLNGDYTGPLSKADVKREIKKAELDSYKLASSFTGIADPVAAIREVNRRVGEPAQQVIAQAVVAQAVAPVAPVQPATPGSPSFGDVTWLTMDQQIHANVKFDDSITQAQAAADAYSDALMAAGDIAELNAAFIGVKNHTLWNTLNNDQKGGVNNDFELLHAQLEASNVGKFDRAVVPSEGKALATPALQQLVDAANRNRPPGSPTVHLMDSVIEFQIKMQQAAPTDARGVFTQGRIFLIRENLKSAEEVAFTLAHEQGHHGLATLLGDRLPAVLNRLWTSPAIRERIKLKMRDLQQSGVLQPAGGMRRLAAEEVMADMFAAGETVAPDIVTKIRAAIENGFATVLGVGKLRMKNAEVDALLRDVGATLQGNSPLVTRLGDPAPADLPSLMADPTPWLAGDARFSRAAAELSQIAAAAAADGNGAHRSINDVMTGFTKVVMDKLKLVGTATARDKVHALFLDATPLNQIANLYPKMFDGGLKVLSRLKTAKESLSNKTLTRMADLTYHGETIHTSGTDVSQSWLKFNEASAKKQDALNALQQTATLYRLFPDVALEAQAKLDHTGMSFTAEERTAAYKDVQKLWKSIGPEGQVMFKKSQAMYSSLWGQHYAALAASIKNDLGVDEFMLDVAGNQIINDRGNPIRTSDFKKAMNERIESSLAKMRQGPYSPLRRYGDYVVTVRTADGKVVHYSAYDTVEQATAKEHALRTGKYAGDGYRVARSLFSEQDRTLDGISQNTIKIITKSVDGLASLADHPQLRHELSQGLAEAYLQSLPQSAFLQHANARKGIEGANEDAMRGYNDYASKAARSIASLTYDGQVSRQMSAMQAHLLDLERGGKTHGDELTKMGRVLGAVRQQHKAAQDFERSKLADGISAAGFVMFLSSPSQLAINGAQTIMVTMPRLAGAYGNSLGPRVFKSAMAQFVRSRGDLLGKHSVLQDGSIEHQVMQALFEQGALDFTQTHDMTGLARGEASAMSGHWRKAMEVAGWSMQKSEVFNRQVAGLASVKGEIAKRAADGKPVNAGHIEELTHIAHDFIDDTQGNYATSNKPKIMQGAWRNVILQFQHYRMNQLAMLARDIRDSTYGTKEEKQSARRALSWMLGTQLAITGVAGTVLAPIAFGIADLFRDDDDLLDSRTESLRFIPQLAGHGVMAHVVDTSRIGANNLLSFGGEYAPKNASAKETFIYYLTAQTPAIGLGANLATGAAALLSGDYLKATKNLMPSGLKAPFVALAEAVHGARDARQVVYYEPNIYDGVIAAAGLRSGSRREAEEKRGAAYEMSSNTQTVQNRLKGRLAMGYAHSDADMINKGMSDVNDWNAKHPDDQIRGVPQVVRSLVRSQQNATQYGIASPRPPSASAKELLGL